MRQLAFVSFMLTALTAVPTRAADSGAPLPAALPWTWTVSKDVLAPTETCGDISLILGVEVTGARNTTFRTDRGGAVQVNVIVVTTEGDAKTIESRLAGAKPAEFIIRHGRVVFELVGGDDVAADLRSAVPGIRAGSADSEE